MPERVQTEADRRVAECLQEKRSFAVIAGAGAGKTYSLIDALKQIRAKYGAELRKNGQRVACITYTKRAVQVIATRLGSDDLFVVSTLHRFLWGEIKTFQKDIQKTLRESRIPQLIAKATEKDNGGNSKTARKARDKIVELRKELKKLDQVTSFRYEDGTFSRYSEGRLSHDDVIEIAGNLLCSRKVFRKAFGIRYPFVLVDEAQDTFPIIVEAFNAVAGRQEFLTIGYFGDPWQQIYEQRAGEFSPPESGEIITKTENFRCSEEVVRFLNAYRKDVRQYCAGDNTKCPGSVQIMLVEAENPAAPRRRYTEEQVDRSLGRMDQALEAWGWSGRDDIMRLFLARQMIARRLGFSRLNSLFTGRFASAAAQEAYESGEHFLLQPIESAVWPLLHAHKKGDQRRVIDLLGTIGPAFDVSGENKGRSLREMLELSKEVISELDKMWINGSVRDVYQYCEAKKLIRMPTRLSEHLARAPRNEEYDVDVHGVEKGDWLCDAFLAMDTVELRPYCDFLAQNTPYSTQHGVKGEQYSDVLVVFDDVEAAWNQYSFSKLLTPKTSGAPKESQFKRSQKLAYVCFSRAKENLRILLYTKNSMVAKDELLQQGLFADSDIGVLF